MRSRTLRNTVTLAVAVGLFLALALACGGGKPVPSKYQGNWIGADGTTIYMTSDGKAGFKAGSKSVDGGGAVIDDDAKTLTISLFGISQTWKIDQEPTDEGVMKLNGTVFKRKS